MILAVDTSALVAGFATWHADHDVARAALAERPVAVGHALLETYSVLTRLPEPHRADPTMVADFLRRNLPDAPLALGTHRYQQLPGELRDLAVSGGAAYDAMIALTALDNDAQLLTLDRRAAITYRRCGVNFVLLGEANKP